MLDTLIRDTRILWRAESIVADVRFRHLLARSGFKAGAGLVAVFGLLMLNITGFFILEPRWGAAWAAGVVGLLDFAVSGLLLALAARTKPGRELDLALEIRQSALDRLEVDARSVQSELVSLRQEVQGIRDATLGILKHPLDAALSGLVVPLAGVLIKSLKKSEPS